MLFVMESRGRDKVGVLHAKLCRPFIHEVCKGRE